MPGPRVLKHQPETQPPPRGAPRLYHQLRIQAGVSRFIPRLAPTTLKKVHKYEFS